MTVPVPLPEPEFWGALRVSVKHWAERLIGVRLGRRADASDLVQEAFLSLWRGAADLFVGLPPDRQQRLARTILRRRLADLLRGHYRQCRALNREVGLNDLASSPSGIEALLGPADAAPADREQCEEHEARLIVALASLPEKEQEAIRCHYYDGESFEAIAATWGLKAASSPMRWAHRGLETLRGIMREE